MTCCSSCTDFCGTHARRLASRHTTLPPRHKQRCVTRCPAWFFLPCCSHLALHNTDCRAPSLRPCLPFLPVSTWSAHMRLTISIPRCVGCVGCVELWWCGWCAACLADWLGALLVVSTPVVLCSQDLSLNSACCLPPLLCAAVTSLPVSLQQDPSSDVLWRSPSTSRQVAPSRTAAPA